MEGHRQVQAKLLAQTVHSWMNGSTGYISSGFFGGLALGRVALLWVNKVVGERRVLFIYGTIALAYVLSSAFVDFSLTSRLVDLSLSFGGCLPSLAMLLLCP